MCLISVDCVLGHHIKGVRPKIPGFVYCCTKDCGCRKMVELDADTLCAAGH